MGRYPATELSRLPRFGFDAGAAAARCITYIGVTFRTRTIDEIREIFDEVRKDIWGAVESRKLQLPIDKVYRFDEIGRPSSTWKPTSISARSW